MPAFNRALSQFEQANTQVLGISVDSVPCNTAWAKDLGGLDYPLLSDFWPHGAMAQKYGVLRNEGITERAVIAIDKTGKIGWINVYDIAELPDPAPVLEEVKRL